MKFVAFDIDGTLTEPEVMEVFSALEGREDIAVGVVSGRASRHAFDFMKQNDVSVNFEEMGMFKVVPLLREKLWLGEGGDEFVYVGNSMRDRFATAVTGWDFIHAEEVTVQKILDI